MQKLSPFAKMVTKYSRCSYLPSELCLDGAMRLFAKLELLMTLSTYSNTWGQVTLRNQQLCLYLHILKSFKFVQRPLEKCQKGQWYPTNNWA